MKNLVYFLIAIAIAFGAYKLLAGDTPLIGGPKLLTNPYPASSPLHKPHQAFVDKVNANPQILAKFAGAGSEQALYRVWNDTLRDGARRLPGERLVAVAKTEVAILARLPEASCAKVIRPRDRFDEALGKDVRDAVERLPERHHKVMTEYTYDALAATVANAPDIAVDQEQLRYAYNSLGARYPGQYGQRLMAVMANPGAASDADACWAVNSLLNTAADLNDDAAEALLRTALGGAG
jgi:hypothetical protein